MHMSGSKLRVFGKKYPHVKAEGQVRKLGEKYPHEQLEAESKVRIFGRKYICEEVKAESKDVWKDISTSTGSSCWKDKLSA